MGWEEVTVSHLDTRVLSSCPDTFCPLLLWCPQHCMPFGSQPGVASVASSSGVSHIPWNLLPFLSPAPGYRAKRTWQLKQQASRAQSQTLPRDPDFTAKTLQAQKARLQRSTASGATMAGLPEGLGLAPGHSSGTR